VGFDVRQQKRSERMRASNSLDFRFIRGDRRRRMGSLTKDRKSLDVIH